jgi:hypothetical protein
MSLCLCLPHITVTGYYYIKNVGSDREKGAISKLETAKTGNCQPSSVMDPH